VTDPLKHAERYGITVPFDGIPLHQHRAWFTRLSEFGYSDVWTAEVDGSDGLTPLALAAAWEPSLKLGTAILSVYTRGPALLAQSAASLAEAAPGRVSIGIGASSPAIVERWNAVPYEHPFQRARDTLAFLKEALSGEKVDRSYETFSVRGFRLSRPVEVPPKLYLAALRPGMLRLAGAEADGVIVNWLGASDVETVLDESGRELDVAARLFVVPTGDAEVARAIGRRMITAYLNVDAYAAFHRWLGRGASLEPMWEAWRAGDRKRALEAIPDEVVDDLIIHGSFSACRQHIARYIAAGVTIPVLALVTPGADLDETIRELSPSHS
jgi:probable F420-dependent oxidoreductase